MQLPLFIKMIQYYHLLIDHLIFILLLILLLLWLVLQKICVETTVKVHSQRMSYCASMCTLYIHTAPYTFHVSAVLFLAHIDKQHHPPFSLISNPSRTPFIPNYLNLSISSNQYYDAEDEQMTMIQ